MANWDFSNSILNNRSGEMVGRGLEQAMQSVSRGISEHRRKIEEKAQEEAAVQWALNKGLVKDEAEGKAAVKAAGGGPQAIAMISELERREQQKKLTEQQLQVGAEQLRQAGEARTRAARNAGALKIATGGQPGAAELGAMLESGASFEATTPGNPVDEEDAVRRYLQSGGDAEGAGELAKTMAQLEEIRQVRKGFRPDVIELGNGIRAMTTSRGSAVPIDRGEADVRELDVGGGRRVKVGPGNRYFDEEGNPVEFASETAPKAPDPLLKSQDPELYEAMRQDYLNYTANRRRGGKSTDAPTTDRQVKDGSDDVVEVSSRSQFDALPKGSRFNYNGRIGTKK